MAALGTARGKTLDAIRDLSAERAEAIAAIQRLGRSGPGVLSAVPFAFDSTLFERGTRTVLSAVGGTRLLGGRGGRAHEGGEQSESDFLHSGATWIGFAP